VRHLNEVSNWGCGRRSTFDVKSVHDRSSHGTEMRNIAVSNLDYVRFSQLRGVTLLDGTPKHLHRQAKCAARRCWREFVSKLAPSKLDWVPPIGCTRSLFAFLGGVSFQISTVIRTTCTGLSAESTPSISREVHNETVNNDKLCYGLRLSSCWCGIGTQWIFW
jgi:hypothetical protein